MPANETANHAQALRTVLVVIMFVTCSRSTVVAEEHTGLVTSETIESLHEGLDWLKARQHNDGSFGSVQAYSHHVAVSSLSGLSLLASGSTAIDGPYAVTISRTIDFVVSQVQPSGVIADQQSLKQGPMYSHGFATLFLAEAYGDSNRDEEIRKILRGAIRIIVQSQNRQGGWRYTVGGGEADISVTVCQMMALRAVSNAGFSVPQETVDRCVEYVQNCRNRDGGFRYQLYQDRDSEFARSAAALVALNNANVQQFDQTPTLRYILQFRPQPGKNKDIPYFYYGHYYASQAMWHAGESFWKSWYPSLRDELLQRQTADGRWTSDKFGDEYATAMALLSLQVPHGYLPIFLR